MPLISVSEYVKEKLDKIKAEEQHKSYDSVIRSLLFAVKNTETKKEGEIESSTLGKDESD